MKTLRKRLLAKTLGCKYKRWSDGYWTLTLLDGSVGSSSQKPMSDKEFMQRLNMYKNIHTKSKQKTSTNLVKESQI